MRFGGFFVLHCHGVSGWRVRRFGGSEGRHVRELSALAAQKVFQGGGSGVLVAQTL